MAPLAPEQIALIAEHGRDVVAVLDESHRVIFSSSSLQAQLGFPPFDAAQADLAWRRLLSFFSQHLR